MAKNATASCTCVLTVSENRLAVDDNKVHTRAIAISFFKRGVDLKLVDVEYVDISKVADLKRAAFFKAEMSRGHRAKLSYSLFNRYYAKLFDVANEEISH